MEGNDPLLTANLPPTVASCTQSALSSLKPRNYG